MELNPKIKNALMQINFVQRYEEISNGFNAQKTPQSERLIYIDGEEVMDMIRDFGYSPRFIAVRIL